MSLEEYLCLCLQTMHDLLEPLRTSHSLPRRHLCIRLHACVTSGKLMLEPLALKLVRLRLASLPLAAVAPDSLPWEHSTAVTNRLQEYQDARWCVGM